MIENVLQTHNRIDKVTRCLTDNCRECTGSYINNIIGHELICKCPCGHTKNEKPLTAEDHRIDLEDMTLIYDPETGLKQAKQEYRNPLTKHGGPITRLGNTFETFVSNPESICEEIKNSSRDDIADKILTSSEIERHCLEKGKKKSKPKNDKLSFSDEEDQLTKFVISPQRCAIIVTVDSNGVDDVRQVVP